MPETGALRSPPGELFSSCHRHTMREPSGLNTKSGMRSMLVLGWLRRTADDAGLYVKCDP